MIIVSGFGRCGSSLVMQMLNAAGVKCAGEYPAFEHDAAKTIDDHDKVNVFAEFEAIKILDPHKFMIPRGNHRSIFVQRDRDQQARSMVKFLIAIGLLPKNAADSEIIRHKLAASFRAEKPLAVDALRRFGPMLDIRFESIITDPIDAAFQIGLFLGLPRTLTDAMAAVVLPRDVFAQPDMSIELRLMDAEPTEAAQ